MVWSLFPCEVGRHSFGGSQWRARSSHGLSAVRPYEIATVDLRDPALAAERLPLVELPLLSHLQVVHPEPWVQRYRVCDRRVVDWVEGDAASGEELTGFPLPRPLASATLAPKWKELVTDDDLLGGEHFVVACGKPISLGAAVEYVCSCGSPGVFVAQVGYGRWTFGSQVLSFYPGEQSERFYYCAACAIVGVVTDGT